MADHGWNHVSDRRLGPRDLPNVLRALTNIQYKWEFLAIQLGLPQKIIETAKFKYPQDPNGCLMYVLKQWLQGNYDTEQFGYPSWRRVCEVTAETAGGDNRALAHEIAAANVRFIEPEAADSAKPTKGRQIILSISIGILLLFVILVLVYLSLPGPLDRYQGYLRDIYRQHEYSIYTKPAEVIAPNRPKQSLNLVMVHRKKNEIDRLLKEEHDYARKGNVDEIRNQKRTIKIEEIGIIPGDKPVAHFVLIEGAPGIGKSTLCWQLCRLWAEGKLQHKWDLMVLIEIRHESMRNAGSVYDLLYHPNDETRELIANKVKEQEGEGLLILFDGYDELSEDQRSELSVFQLVLTNRRLSKATVVVTSRPMATRSLPSQFRKKLDQYIVIEGFDNDTIYTYIRSACGNKRNLLENFHTYVSSRPFILSVMSNPLHCTIVTELYIQYWQDGQRGFAPNTLTELYRSLFLNLISRNLTDNVWHMSDLPAQVNNSLMQLTELAASGLKEEKYVFSNVPNDTLGLMVRVRQIYDIRASKPAYMFLHLTLQEYLSALYWSQQTQQQLIGMDDFLKQENILSCMQSCIGIGTIYDRTHCESIHWPHILFLAGLTKLSHPFFLDLIPEDSSDEYVDSLCQLAFEAQSPQILSTMLSSRKFVIRGHCDELDTFSLGYCIANSDNTTIWDIKYVNIYKEVHLFPTFAYFSTLSGGLYYSLNTTDWNARPSRPSVHLRIHVKFLSVPKIDLLTNITSKLVIDDEKFNSGEWFSLLQYFSQLFPRLVSLELPALSFILTDSPQLPQSLVSIRHLTLPHYKVLLDNLHEYPALEDLEIYTYMYEDFQINFCPPQKIYENYYQSLQVENNDVCLILERKLPKLAHKLKTFGLHDVHIDHLCVHGIAHLLNTSLDHLTLHNCLITSTDFDSLITAMASSKLKQLEIIYQKYQYKSMPLSKSRSSINLVRGRSLAKLLTQSKTLEEVTVEMGSDYTNDCNVARLLVEAMTHSSVKKLIVKKPYSCNVSDIHYDRDRVLVVN